MVMETVDNHLVRRFSDTMHVLQQQSKARTRPYVMEKPFGKGEDWAYDGIGTVTSREKTARFAPSTPDDIDHWRRKIAKREFVITLYIDESDLESRLTDPEGQYAAECLKEMERRYDRVVVDAAHATVYTGKEFETSVSFASDGGRTVDATSGLTIGKIIEVNKNYMDDEVGNDMPVERCMSMTGDEYEDMLDIAELTSGDFSRQFALDKGEIVRVVGIDLIPYGASVNDPIIPVSGGVRTNFVIAKGGIVVGLARQWKITIKDRPDLVNVKQVQVTGVVGATRTEGKLVQKFNTTD